MSEHLQSILFHPRGWSVQNEGSEIPGIGLLSLLSNRAFTETSRFVGRFFSPATPPYKVQYQTVNQLNASNGRRGAGAILSHPLCDGLPPTRTRPRNDIVWSERANRFGKECLSKKECD